MRKRVLFGIGILFLAGCSESTDGPVPHNRVSVDNKTQESVIFTFNETNRFNRVDLNLGIPTLHLRNSSFLPLETDFHITVEHYNDGWEELEAIDYFVKDYDYALHKDDALEFSLFTDHFETDLDSGRYRFTLEYALFDEENDETRVERIGTVFWLDN